MYGKLENGKLIFPKRKMIKDEQGHISFVDKTVEELKAEGFKEVLNGQGTGSKAPGFHVEPSFEDIGDYIIRRINWVAD